ncbi:hypothetical protein BJ742DRAFT_329640 [Cladochytrium replicatum]|nr:hypothetical protein BJ742DRAFT_329640 [Cladochytrium replicatum]
MSILAEIVAAAAEGERQKYTHLKEENIQFMHRSSDIQIAYYIQLVIGFCKKLPSSCMQHNSGIFLETVSVEVERALLLRDLDLHLHLGTLFAQKVDQNNQHNMRGMLTVCECIIGDFFSDTCSLPVTCYIFDQFIIGSFEFTENQLLPPVSLWISWFTVCILSILRERILALRCGHSILSMIISCLPNLNVSQLQAEMERQFVEQLRMNIQQNVFGFNLYKTMGRNTVHVAQCQRYEAQEFEELTEDLLVANERKTFWELQEDQRQKFEWKTTEKERIKDLMNRWRKIGRCVGIWMICLRGQNDSLGENMFQMEWNRKGHLHPGYTTPKPPTPSLPEALTPPVVPIASLSNNVSQAPLTDNSKADKEERERWIVMKAAALAAQLQRQAQVAALKPRCHERTILLKRGTLVGLLESS